MHRNSEKKYIDGDRGPFISQGGEVEKNVRIALVGLSFSMTRYSDPGEYNEDICMAMMTDAETLLSGNELFAFVQWEIADALGAQQTSYKVLKELITIDRVCEPYMFTPEQILKPRAMIRRLLHADKNSHLYVVTDKLDKMCAETGIALSSLENEEDRKLAERLAARLNALLANRDFWAAFGGKLELDNLTRQFEDHVWTEIRELPPPDHIVGKYQSRRLAAFILEKILGKEILQPTKYISTKTVLDNMIAEAQRERFVPDYIYIYAHEAHSPRVRWQTFEAIYHASRGPAWLLTPERVIERGGTNRWNASDNAQNWTDNQYNWNKYNNDLAASN